MNKLFDTIPPNFFNVLSCPMQETYSDCLFLMYQYFSNKKSFGANRDEIIDLIVEYFQNINAKPARQQAISVLHRFKECGWLFEEEDSNYEININLTDYAIVILNTLNELRNRHELSYTGYLYVIYTLVKNIEKNSLTDILDQVVYNTNILMNKLKSLSSNIKRYLQNLINNKDQDNLKQIVNNLFIDYKKEVIDEYYQKLKTSDNLSKYRPFIINHLNEISINESLIKSSCLELMEKRKYESIEEAKNYILNQIHFIIVSLQNIGEIITEIDQKNSRYIQVSITKILFIVNNTQDLSGKIRHIITSLRDGNNKINANELFRISNVHFLDKRSIYTFPSYQDNKTPQVIALEKGLPSLVRMELLEKIKENNRFFKKQILKFVSSLLKGEKEITASNIPLNTLDDFIKIILVYLYAFKDVNFKIVKLDTMYQKNGYEFFDFIIRRNNDA